MNKEEFKTGKLYYRCTWSIGKYPVPHIQAYILDRADEDGLYFIAPEELNARGPLAKLSEDDQHAIRNILAIDGGLYVPYTELGNMFRTPDGAIDFLKKSFADRAHELEDLM